MSNHPVETVTASGDKVKIALAVFAVVALVWGVYQRRREARTT